MDASNLRTAATQAIASKFADEVESQTTFPSADPTRAHGEITCRDGRVYRVEVTLVTSPTPPHPDSWESIFAGNSRHRS